MDIFCSLIIDYTYLHWHLPPLLWGPFWRVLADTRHFTDTIPPSTDAHTFARAWIHAVVLPTHLQVTKRQRRGVGASWTILLIEKVKLLLLVIVQNLRETHFSCPYGSVCLVYVHVLHECDLLTLWNHAGGLVILAPTKLSDLLRQTCWRGASAGNYMKTSFFRWVLVSQLMLIVCFIIGKKADSKKWLLFFLQNLFSLVK